MRFDDDDGLDEEADFELQTRRFTSDAGHLFALLLTETTVPLELPRPWWCPRQSMEESAREDDDMMTMMMIRVLRNAAVVSAVVLRLNTFIQNPNKKNLE